METRTVTVVAEDGTPVTLNVPTTLPTEERAEYLRRLFADEVDGVSVTFPDGDWKGRAHAVAHGRALLADTKEAFEFMGALVDEVTAWPGGRFFVSSKGYHAHGF